MNISRPTAASLQPAASLVDWARRINGLAAKAISAQALQANPSAAGRLDEPSPSWGSGPHVPLLTRDNRLASSAPIAIGTAAADVSFRMAPEVAEHLVADGLDPDFLQELASASGLESRDVLDFAGIDRTTVSRRKASGAALPQDAAVKALQATDLLTQATEVFGSPALASAWLSKPHPSLDGQTPLRRARTPWGMDKVRSMLVGLRYGSAA